MIDTVCCDEVLTLYGIDRMRNPPYYDLLAEDMDHHPGCIGKGSYAASASASLLTPAHLHVCVSVVSIPLSRLPENEEIEQWYSFTGNTTSQTFTRAAIRVSLKFTAVAPSSPLHHHPPRHPSFIGHPSSDPSTHVDEAMEDEAASTDLCLPTGLVDYVLLVGPPSSRCPDADKTPTDNVILKRYPPHDRTDFPLPTKIEWFCFPGGYEATLSEEHCRRPPHPKQFTFVLSGGADGLSKCYGSCVWGYEPIAAASLPTRWHPQCLCMLSRVPNLLEFMQDAAIALMWQYMHGVDLAEAYCTHLTTTIPRPIPNLLDVSITLAGLTWRLSMPRRQQRNPTANKHPELPSSLSAADRGRSEPPSSVLLPPLPYSMSVFFDCFPVAVIVQLVILGLCEHRIVVHSTQLSLLCPVTETLKALMYPFRWQHPYVPMLPRILSEYLQAPLPYILGVHSSWLPSLFEGGRPDHLVLVDADRGTITSSFTTHSDTQPPVLPLGLTRDLYTRLKRFKAEAWSPVVEHNIRLSVATYITTMLTGYIYFPTTMLTFDYDEISTHMDAFHSMYTLLCKAQDQSPPLLWMEVSAQSSIVKDGLCDKVLVVPLDQPPILPGSLYAMAKAIQSRSLVIVHDDAVAGGDMGPVVPFLKVWTLDDVAAAVGLDKATLEEAVYPKHSSGGSHDTLSHTLHRQLSTEEEKVEQSMHKCLVGIFSSDDTLLDGVREACEASFKAPYARELFVLILMQPHHRPSTSSESFNGARGSGSCLGDVGFRLLVSLASEMLEQCHVHEDFTNARGLLQVSAQFYRVVPGTTHPQHHPIPPNQLGTLGGNNHLYLHEPTDAAAIVTDDMFFSHMGSLVYDMLSVDVPLVKVHTFVCGMCSTYSKPKDLHETLATLVDNLHRALVLSMETSSLPSSPLLLSTCHAPMWTTSSSNNMELHASSAPSSQYDLDTVIRRKLSNVSDASSSSDNVLIATSSPISCLAVQGQHVVAGCIDGSMHLYANDAVTHHLDGHGAPITHAQVRGHAVVSTSYDATVRVWNLHAYGTSPRSRPKPPFLRFLAATDTEWACRVLRGHTSPVVALELGKQLAVDRVLLATGSWDKSIRIWDSTKEASVLHLAHASAITCLKFLATSSVLVSGDAGAGLDVWDVVHGGRKKGHFTAHRSGITELQVAGDRLVSASNDRSLKVWDVHFRSGQSCTHVLMGHSGPVTCVALGGPADPTICSGSADGVVKVWDLRATGKGARLELTGHGGRITTLQRDFTKVISGSEDGTLRVWNMYTGVCGQVLAGHRSGITGVGFHDPNLLSVSWDGTVRVWDVNVDS
ncbi:hypothetical protein DYB30_004395 [Aphanomyces astaci]|uniref:UDENN domain-containing protein n=1 Tax=Aphanomyces astaci TaxID=112090 RepID=A0A397CR02_APHAT|nr:hypothetical protein DYB30_004395 [Aphanomyces astaci]